MYTTVLKIDAMDSEGCADKVTRILKQTDGVSEVSVSLRDGMAIMRVDESLTSPHLITRALTLAGYPSYANDEALRPAAAANPPASPGNSASACCGGCGGG